MWYVRGKRVELLLHLAGCLALAGVAVAVRAPVRLELIILFAAGVCTYYLSDVHSVAREQSSWRALAWIVGANLALTAVGSSFLGFSRALAIFGTQAAYQLLARLLVVLLLRKQGGVIVVGSGAQADAVVEAAARRRGSREPVRCADPREIDAALLSVGRAGATVVVALSNGKLAEALPPLVLLAARGVRVMDGSTYLELLEGVVPPGGVSERWFFDGGGFALLRSPWVGRVKRAADVLIALVALIVLVPLLLLCALCVKLSSPGPAFFLQERTGKGGRPFRIVKFRTMVVHDPGRHSRYPADRDPRITRLGALMRRSHLDELPQLINILRGDMSLIGPRAEWSALVNEYRSRIPCYDLRHMVRPGVTGWAQVCYRYSLSVDDAAEKLRYDLFYLKHYSIFLDLVIAARTVKTVLLGKAR